MSQQRTVTYPAGAVQLVADRLQDFDWNVPHDEAMEFAENVVLDVTLAVDQLRASEGRGVPYAMQVVDRYASALRRISEAVAKHDGDPGLANRIRAIIASLDQEPPR